MINGVNTFLPVVQEAARSRQTAIVITGSKQGITNPPGNPAYNASKAAVKSLAEHLSCDLRNAKTTVHLLVPGWTFTRLVSCASDARSVVSRAPLADGRTAGKTGGGQGKEKPAGAWTPEQVVEHLCRKMGEGTFYVMCPDNDVSQETDKRRVLWSAGDLVEERPPLSRWRDEWKKEAEEAIARTQT